MRALSNWTGKYLVYGGMDAIRCERSFIFFRVNVKHIVYEEREK